MNPIRAIARPITSLGGRAIALLEFIGGMGFLWTDTIAAIPRALGDKRGRRLGWANLWAQMVRVGVRSIPIVSLVVFCIGAILALQMAPILRELRRGRSRGRHHRHRHVSRTRAAGQRDRAHRFCRRQHRRRDGHDGRLRGNRSA